MKRSWWETDNAHGILIIFVNVICSCLVYFKNDSWIYWSAIYMYVGTFIYHITVNNKNSDIEYLERRIYRLERYASQLEELLKKEGNLHQE